MGFKIEQRVFELLPVGIYPAQITEAQLEDGKFGQQVKVTFALLDPVHEGRTLIGWAGASFTTKSKLYAWTRAAFGGREIPKNWDFDSDRLIGRKVNVVLVTAKGQDGVTEYNKIHELRPYSNGQAPTAQQPTIAAPAVDMGPSREPSDAEDPGEEPLW